MAAPSSVFEDVRACGCRAVLVSDKGVEGRWVRVFTCRTHAIEDARESLARAGRRSA